MSIEYLGKNKAKLVVNTGSGKNRKRKTKIVTYKTKSELKEIYRKFEDEVRHNPLIDTSVKELVEMYIKSRKPLGVEATTIKGYKIAAERIYSRIGDLNASELTSYQVQDFIAALDEKYAPKTIKHTVTLLSAAYENAVRLDQLQKNPCKLCVLPKQERKEIDIFSEGEIRSFCAALNKVRLDYKVAYELALFCGMRRSEILGLKNEDVNITFKALSINKTRHVVDGEIVVQGTKTKSSQRTLAVPDFVIEDISHLIELHESYRFDTTDFLIQDGFGKPMTPTALSTRIYQIEKDAGLPNVSIHDLRHTFASMLNAAHVDIAMISRELGHSSIGITLNTYTHVFGNVTESSRGIADALNNKYDGDIKPATFVPLSEERKTAEANDSNGSVDIIRGMKA